MDSSITPSDSSIHTERPLRNFLGRLIGLRCYSCSEGSGPICNICKDNYYFLSEPRCWRCGYPFPNDKTQQIRHNSKEQCKFCRKFGLGMERLWSAVTYEGTPKNLIRALKFYEQPTAAKYLADYIKVAWKEQFPTDCILVPVPLSEKRLKERGYNQSALIAAELQTAWHIPLTTKAIKRVRHSDPLSHTHLTLARRQMMANAFAPTGSHLLENKCVILVDDVCTTSTTLSACAIACKEAGARMVWGITVARAMRPWETY